LPFVGSILRLLPVLLCYLPVSHFAICFHLCLFLFYNLFLPIFASHGIIVPHLLCYRLHAASSASPLIADDGVGF
jgi:hypothetical protein